MEKEKKQVEVFELLIDCEAALTGALRSCQELSRYTMRKVAFFESFDLERLEKIKEDARWLNSKLNILECDVCAKKVVNPDYYVKNDAE